MSPWPNPLGGEHPLVAWLMKWLNRCRESEITSVRGGRLVENGQNGRALIINQPPILSLNSFFPFKIYPVGVPAGAPDGTLAWQCWQVRSGLAAGRSQNFIDTGNFGDYYRYGEERRQVLTGTDGLDFLATTTKPNPLETNQIVLLTESGDVGADAGNTATFIINNELDTFQAICASFWIEINDDPLTGLSFQIKSRRWTMDVAPPFAHFKYPIAPNVIPIGYVLPKDGPSAPTNPYDLVTYQELFDHAVNRYATGAGGASPSFWRGYWIDDNLSGKVFWPGDEFEYDDADNVYLLTYTGVPAVLSGIPVGQSGVITKVQTPA